MTTTEAALEARRQVREYLELVEPDLRAGRLRGSSDKDVREAAATIIESHEVTPEIKAHLVNMLRNEKPWEQSCRGSRTPLRDSQIVCAVSLAIECGVNRTRGRETKSGAIRSDSACSIVSEELRALGFGLSEASVEQIWDRFKRRAAPGFLSVG